MDRPEDMRIGEQVDSKSIAGQPVAGSSPVSSAFVKLFHQQPWRDKRCPTKAFDLRFLGTRRSDCSVHVLPDQNRVFGSARMTIFDELVR